MDPIIVQYIWNKFLKTGTVHDLTKSGRPHKCIVRERRLIYRTSKKQPFTAHEVALTCDMVNTVSADTVKRYLRNAKPFGRMASRKPFLSSQHIKNRKSWCVTYLKMNPEEWKSFIFSGECRFKTYAHITRLVRRPRNNRYSKKFVIETRKYGGSSVMVWGAIKGNCSRILVQCP